MTKKTHRIIGVKPGSIAEESGIEPGDSLLTIGGEDCIDLLDLLKKTSSEELEIMIQKSDGENWIIEIEKEIYEDLGLIFDDRIMDTEKRCENKCMFCFIDQLPEGMRSTLYFKDDDWRLSFLMGNYVTLTNLSDSDIERIIKERISPLYVSVHSTKDSLRQQLMGNTKAGNIMEILRMFKEAGIKVNCQIVLCPGLNDRIEFDNTISDLLSMWPSVQSIAAVPVGLTSHRQNLPTLQPFCAYSAERIISQVEKWQSIIKPDCGTAFVFAADEFYILASRQFPCYEAYEEFPQLENGVGLVAKFTEEFNEAILGIEPLDFRHSKVSIATGLSAYPIIKKLAYRAFEKFGSDVEVYPIVNNFLGERVTVAGLVSGCDIIEQMKHKELGERLLIPSSMLRAEGDVFLDDLSVDDVANTLSVPVIPVPVNGREFLTEILYYKE